MWDTVSVCEIRMQVLSEIGNQTSPGILQSSEDSAKMKNKVSWRDAVVGPGPLGVGNHYSWLFVGIYHPKWAHGTHLGIFGWKLNILVCAEISRFVHLCDGSDSSQHLCEQSSSSVFVDTLTFNRKVLTQRPWVITILEVGATNYELIKVDLDAVWGSSRLL